jgi:hypothetical protein
VEKDVGMALGGADGADKTNAAATNHKNTPDGWPVVKPPPAPPPPKPTTEPKPG